MYPRDASFGNSSSARRPTNRSPSCDWPVAFADPEICRPGRASRDGDRFLARWRFIRPAAGYWLLLADGQGAATDTRTIHDDNRMLKLECGCTSQYAVEQPKHLAVRVRASAKQDDAWPVGPLERNQA